MSSKERVLAAVARQPVDYVPCAPFMNFQDWPQRVGKRWQYPFGPSIHEMLEYMVGELGVDQIVEFSWGYFPEEGVSSEVWMEDDIIHKKFITPAGELHAAVRFDENWPHGLDIPLFSDYNPSHYVEPWIKSFEDLECLRYILLPPHKKKHFEEIRFRVRVAKHLAEKYQLATCFSFGLGLTGALLVFGPIQVCKFAVTEPKLIDTYLEIDHQFNLKNYDVALELGVDMVRRNGFYETCDFYSPAMLERFLGKRLREEIKLVHDAGKLIGYTLLTGVMPMLDYLARLDFDCIMCLDVFMKGADAVKIKQKLGDRKSFWTGPSDTIHMPWNKTNEVRKAVRYVFEVFGKRGLLITPCSSSKAVFPWENVLAMIDEWKKLRRYEEE